MNQIFDCIEVIDKIFDNWEMCVDYVKEVFVGKNWATEEYFEFIKKDLIENDSYMVLTPHIVLLHSAPNHGALENRFYIAKLITSVNFNHELNDPVQIVMAFTAVDEKEHIGAIQKLALMMLEPDFLTSLLSANNQIELSTVLKQFESKERND